MVSAVTQAVVAALPAMMSSMEEKIVKAVQKSIAPPGSGDIHEASKVTSEDKGVISSSDTPRKFLMQKTTKNVNTKIGSEKSK